MWVTVKIHDLNTGPILWGTDFGSMLRPPKDSEVEVESCTAVEVRTGLLKRSPSNIIYGEIAEKKGARGNIQRKKEYGP